MMDKNGQELAQPNYPSARTGYVAVRDDQQALPENRAAARLGLTVMDYFGQGLAQPNYPSARTGFVAVRDDQQALPQDRASAQLKLATMDRKKR